MPRPTMKLATAMRTRNTPCPATKKSASSWRQVLPISPLQMPPTAARAEASAPLAACPTVRAAPARAPRKGATEATNL